MGERRPLGEWPACIIVVGGMLLAACGSSATAPKLNTTIGGSVGSSSTTQPTIAHTTVAPDPTAETLPSVTTTSTTTSSTTTTTVGERGALEFVDAKLLGIRQGSLLTFAAEVLGVTPVPLFDVEFDPPIRACTGTPDPWVIQSGGLTLVFESTAPDAPFVTNWTYTGGPAAGFPEIVAPHGIRIGDPRSKLEEANPGFTDYVDEVDVGSPFYLRYGVENNIVNWFGIIDCVFE